MVFFKIFSDTSLTRVKYMSGKKAIKPASKAAEEACDLMGKRRFLQIMVQDNMCQERYKVTDEMDVTTLRDYMQVSVLLILDTVNIITAKQQKSARYSCQIHCIHTF